MNDFKYVLSEKKNSVYAIVICFFLSMFFAVCLHLLINEREQKFPKPQNTEAGYIWSIGEDDSKIIIPYNIDSSVYFTDPNGMILNIEQVDSEDFKINYQGKMLSFNKMNQFPTKMPRITLANGKEVVVYWINGIEDKYLNLTHVTSEIVVYDKNVIIAEPNVWLNVNRVNHQKIDNDKFRNLALLSNKINMLEVIIRFCLCVVTIMTLSSIILPLIIIRYFGYQYYGLNKAEFEFLSIISNLSLEQRKKLLYRAFNKQNIDENFDTYNIQLKRYFQIYHNKSKLYKNIKQSNDFNMLINHINKLKDILHIITDDWKTLMEQKDEFELICKEIDRIMNINKIKQVEFNAYSIIEENKANFFDITKHNFSTGEFKFFSYPRNIKLDMIFFLKNKSPEIYFNLDKYIEQNNKIIEQMKKIYFDEAS